ncbi:hypothetical protein [Streptacidiphilus sp. MAP5-3]|uniref:hypothetical protein n=1 Tax=unclassified Streptacidiphilus TaxID=2643834 RepID=UPI0035150F04
MGWLRRHLIRVGDGSPELFWRLARRTVAGTARDRLTRTAAILVGLWIWWRLINVWPWLTGVLLAAWIARAWLAADAEEQQEERQAEAAEELERTLDEVYLRLILRHIGEEPGIHLETLLPLMQSEAQLPGLTRDDLRDLLGALRVPVRRSLRVGTRTGVAGVHHDDAVQALKEYLARLPSPEV